MADQARVRFWRGFASAVAGAALWGFSGACAQFLFDECGASPTFVTAVRTASAGVLFLVVLAVRDRAALRGMFGARGEAAKLCLFALGLFGSQFTFALSVACTNAGTATVLQMLSTVFIMLYVCARARALPHAFEVAGLALAAVGTVAIATQGNPGVIVLPVAGLVWGVLNGLAVALYVICPKETGLFARYGSFAVTGCGIALGSVAAAVAFCAEVALDPSAASSVASLDATAWLVLLGGVGFAGTFVAFSLYLHGVAMVGSVTGGLVGAVEPVGACACAALWLHTAFSGWDWLGLACMLAMLVLVTLKPQQEGQQQEGR